MPRVLVAAFSCLLLPAAATAQVSRVLPAVAFDLRGATVSMKADATTATDLGVGVTDLPGRGFGGSAGLHVYPVRRPNFSIGIGGEAIFARASKNIENAEGEVTNRVARRLMGMGGAVSLNFGGRDGWSYLTGGIGPLRYETFAGDAPLGDPPPYDLTINFGGGARWFTRPHVAFTFDVRYYETRPADRTVTTPGRERQRLLVIGIGMSLK